MKIALPIKGTEVDGHFGQSEAFVVCTINERNELVSEERLTPPSGCGCKSNLPKVLAAQGVSVLLAGSMGKGAVDSLKANSIEVVLGCSGSYGQVIDSWLAGKLVTRGGLCSAAHAHADEHEHPCKAKSGES